MKKNQSSSSVLPLSGERPRTYGTNKALYERFVRAYQVQTEWWRVVHAMQEQLDEFLRYNTNTNSECKSGQ